jgi:hypothetical protein
MFYVQYTYENVSPSDAGRLSILEDDSYDVHRIKSTTVSYSKSYECRLRIHSEVSRVRDD